MSGVAKRTCSFIKQVRVDDFERNQFVASIPRVAKAESTKLLS